MRSDRFSIFLLMLVLLMVSGCEFKDVKLENVQGFKINSIHDGHLKGTISLVLTNPNSFPITVKSGEFDIYSGQVKMGDAKLSKSFKIKSDVTDTYEVELEGSMGEMLAAGISGLAGLISGKKPQMTVKGEMKAGNLFYSKKFPVEITTEMPINL